MCVFIIILSYFIIFTTDRPTDRYAVARVRLRVGAAIYYLSDQSIRTCKGWVDFGTDTDQTTRNGILQHHKYTTKNVSACGK